MRRKGEGNAITLRQFATQLQKQPVKNSWQARINRCMRLTALQVLRMAHYQVILRLAFQPIT